MGMGSLTDLAVTFAAYAADTAGIITQANAVRSDILLRKIASMAGLFAHRGADGQMPTCVFRTNHDQTIAAECHHTEHPDSITN